MYRHSGPSLKDFYLSRVRFRVGIFFFNSIPGDPKQQPGLKTILRKLPEKKKSVLLSLQVYALALHSGIPKIYTRRSCVEVVTEDWVPLDSTSQQTFPVTSRRMWQQPAELE